MLIALIAFKAILVTLIGILLSRSLGADYKITCRDRSLDSGTHKETRRKNFALEQVSYHAPHDLKSPLIT